MWCGWYQIAQEDVFGSRTSRERNEKAPLSLEFTTWPYIFYLCLVAWVRVCLKVCRRYAIGRLAIALSCIEMNHFHLVLESSHVHEICSLSDDFQGLLHTVFFLLGRITWSFFFIAIPSTSRFLLLLSSIFHSLSLKVALSKLAGEFLYMMSVLRFTLQRTYADSLWCGILVNFISFPID